jgi:A/G-specific adenine glycosylase
MIMERMEGNFPSEFDMMMKIPGIGRSTAGAIAAFSFNQKKAILDGNVKRVLSRYFLISEWTGLPKTEKKLWHYAESILPNKNIDTYTQALMDLGATLCNKKPQCNLCPLNKTCLAFQKSKVHLIPTPRPQKKIPTESTHMIIIKHHDEILLVKRPQSGIWGGLWSLPQHENTSITPKTWIKKHFGLETSLLKKDLKASTTFTHFKLDITYSILEAKSQRSKTPHTWLSLNHIEGAGIPSIIKKILLKI